MNTIMRIEEFHGLLESEKAESDLLNALRKLKTHGKPEDIKEIRVSALAVWNWK